MKSLREKLNETEKEHLIAILHHHKGVIRDAKKTANVTERYMHVLIKKHGIDAKAIKQQHKQPKGE